MESAVVDKREEVRMRMEEMVETEVEKGAHGGEHKGV